MTAFDTAWDLVKEYTPKWRNVARDLPKVSVSERQKLIDTAMEEMLGGGASLNTFIHPHNPNFVVKYPTSHLTDENPISGRIGYLNDDGKSMSEILEDHGFPVVSEYNVNDDYLVQPILGVNVVGKYSSEKGRPPIGIADIPLNHILSDRVSANWGRDQTGNWRMLDTDMARVDPYDWFPNPEDGKTAGQIYQENLDKFNIQLPASSILNVLDEGDYGMDSMRTLMENIEPYSDNPKYVTVEGKPVWREGY